MKHLDSEIVNMIVGHANNRDVFSMWTLYDKPSDYPDVFVARRFHLQDATDDIIITETVDELRDYFKVAGLSVLPRYTGDDSNIVECWV